MGQYWLVVNLDKREFINPHRLGAGLKLWEQLAAHPGTGAALLVLCAAMPEQRGGGDFDLDSNWHGPERTFPKHNITPGPMPEDYQSVARRTIGRWSGDRIALVGDYAEDSDLAELRERKCATRATPTFADDDPLSSIYEKCRPETEIVYHESDKPVPGETLLYQVAPDCESNEGLSPHAGQFAFSRTIKPSEYLDISDDVARVLEHELNGTFSGDGWRSWKEQEATE
jgi:hypothetical protein